MAVVAECRDQTLLVLKSDGSCRVEAKLFRGGCYAISLILAHTISQRSIVIE